MSDAALTQALEARLGPGEFKPLSGRGNSRVGLWQGAEAFFVKRYPADPHWDRRRVEAETVAFYAANGVTAIPRLLHTDEAHNYSVFNFIDGTPEYDVDDEAFGQIRAFLDRVMSLRDPVEKIGEAKEAFFHTSVLRSHIDGRYAFLKKIDDPLLQNHLAARFEKALDQTRYTSLADGACGARPIVSPSDFGTHNSLRAKSGALTFIDFEYGGRDSKCKLLADIYWHPGSALNDGQRRELIEAFLEGTQEHVVFEQVKLMMGLKWALLVLNEFIPGQIEKRLRAALTKESADEIKSRQLAKSQAILDKIGRI